MNQEYSGFLEDVNSVWQPAEKLSDDALRLLLAMNNDLRRAYDESPDRSFGSDEHSKPLLGWEHYYSQHL